VSDITTRITAAAQEFHNSVYNMEHVTSELAEVLLLYLEGNHQQAASSSSIIGSPGLLSVRSLWASLLDSEAYNSMCLFGD
jgi:hypothetical protein